MYSLRKYVAERRNRVINERFAAGSTDKVVNLIVQYLEKRLGTLYKMPGVEHFRNSHGEGYGLRYFTAKGRSFRLNWKTDSTKGEDITSIDVWTGKQHDPDIEIDTKGVSLVKVLPSLADLIIRPQIGDIAVVAEGVVGGIALTEARGADPAEIYGEIIDLIASGQPFSAHAINQIGRTTGASIWRKIYKSYPEMFELEQRGMKQIFKLKAKARLDKIDKNKIIGSMIGLHVNAGGTGEDYTSPEIARLEREARKENAVPYEDQLDDLRKLVKATVKGASNALFVGGRGGTGKALAHGTPVLTPTGEWVPIENIREGDYVVTHDGSPTRVTGVFPQGTLDTYEVTTRFGQTVTVSGDHLWEVHCYKWSAPKVVTTLELRDLMEASSCDTALQLPAFRGIEYPHADLPIDPWLLGVILGDGSISQRSVRITSKDDYVFERVADTLADGYRLSDNAHDSITRHIVRTSTTGRGRRSKYVEAIERLNLLGTTSDTKFIPEVYMRASKAQRMELLRGLMDTDGTVEKTGSISISTASELMANQLAELVRSIGGHASITSRPTSYRTKTGEVKQCLTSYTVRIRYATPADLFSLPRKRSAAPATSQYAGCGVALKSIVPTGRSEECTCIRVDDPSHLFVTKDYIVTHNTHTVEKALEDLGLSDGNGYFKNTTSASASGMYKTLYDHRNDVILFDDCDAIFKDQEGRNLLKAATDTRKERKLSWMKNASWIYKGNPENLEAEDDPFADEDDEDKLYPKYFTFRGRIIFISNLQLDQLDPDGALRTRGFVISINPTNEEVFSFMEKVLDTIQIDDGLSLSSAERRKVLEVLRSSSNKDDVNMRKLVRGLNMAAAGVPGWETLVSRYA